MLTPIQIIEVESVFLSIDSIVDMPLQIKCDVILHFYKKNKEQYIYLMWLIHRWYNIREHKYHLPNKKYKENLRLSEIIDYD